MSPRKPNKPKMVEAVETSPPSQDPVSELAPAQAEPQHDNLSEAAGQGGAEPVEPGAPEAPTITAPPTLIEEEIEVPMAVEAPAAGEPPVIIEAIEPARPEEAQALESSDEVEETQADVVDSEMALLLSTPIGLRGAIEALLFISPEPLSTNKIARTLGVSDIKVVAAVLTQLRNEYDNDRRGIQILETASGYQMGTRELFGDLILKLRNRKRRPSLSPAALETLAIIAYRQPIIRAEVEAIRGVESSGTIRNLIDMGMVEMVGRKEVLGRPPMYGTAEAFLQSFGLRNLNDLPSIGELKRQFMESAKVREEAEASAAAVPREMPAPLVAENAPGQPAPETGPEGIAAPDGENPESPALTEAGEDRPEEAPDTAGAPLESPQSETETAGGEEQEETAEDEATQTTIGEEETGEMPTEARSGEDPAEGGDVTEGEDNVADEGQDEDVDEDEGDDDEEDENDIDEEDEDEEDDDAVYDEDDEIVDDEEDDEDDEDEKDDDAVYDEDEEEEEEELDDENEEIDVEVDLDEEDDEGIDKRDQGEDEDTSSENGNKTKP